jgi:hypothetical protein
MADFILPIESGIPLLNFETELTGELFTFQMQYNKREDSWYMNILNADTQEQIRTGVKVVVNQSLLNTLRDSSIRPQGQFIAINNISADEDPKFEDLGNNVKILYSEFDS